MLVSAFFGLIIVPFFLALLLGLIVSATRSDENSENSDKKLA